jgi:hypothetical protein
MLEALMAARQDSTWRTQLAGTQVHQSVLYPCDRTCRLPFYTEEIYFSDMDALASRISLLTWMARAGYRVDHELARAINDMGLLLMFAKTNCNGYGQVGVGRKIH